MAACHSMPQAIAGFGGCYCLGFLRLLVCPQIHSCISTPCVVVYLASIPSASHYAAFTGAKPPTNCDAHLPESNLGDAL